MIKTRSIFSALIASTTLAFGSPVFAQSVQDNAQLSMRMERMEQQLRDITGQIEQLTYQMRMMQQGNSAAPAGNDSNNLQRQQAFPQQAPQSLAPADSSPSTQNGLQQQPQPYQIGPRSALPSNSSVAAAQGFTAEASPSSDLQPKNLGQLTLQDVTSVQQEQGLAVSHQGPIDLNDLTGSVYASASAAPSQLVLAPSADPKDEYDLAYGYILHGDYVLAEAGFRQFLDSHPDHELVPNARYWLGEAYYGRGDYRNAADSFLSYYKSNPQGSKASDSMVKLGLSLKQLGAKTEACATFNKVVTDFPDAPQVVKTTASQEYSRSGCTS